MFGFIGKIKKGIDLYKKISVAIDEGKDIFEAADRISQKYGDLPEDVKEAWDEVNEFIKAIKNVF